MLINGELKKSGFTLLEVMVAISIIAIAFMSIFNMQAGSVSMQIKANFYSTASILASSKMNMITVENSPPEDSSGDFGETYPGYTWSTTISTVESEELGDFSENLYMVDLTISLNEENSYTVRKYVYKNK